MNGIYFLRGPGIEPGTQVEGASLMDIAPTILALMGVPIPTLMDGHVLSAQMSRELRNRLHTRFVEQETPGAVDSGGQILGEEDEKIIRERLEALGYLG